jgi:hypothetical protein
VGSRVIFFLNNNNNNNIDLCTSSSSLDSNANVVIVLLASREIFRRVVVLACCHQPPDAGLATFEKESLIILTIFYWSLQSRVKSTALERNPIIEKSTQEISIKLKKDAPKRSKKGGVSQSLYPIHYSFVLPPFQKDPQ